MRSDAPSLSLLVWCGGSCSCPCSHLRILPVALLSLALPICLPAWSLCLCLKYVSVIMAYHGRYNLCVQTPDARGPAQVHRQQIGTRRNVCATFSRSEGLARRSGSSSGPDPARAAGAALGDSLDSPRGACPPRGPLPWALVSLASTCVQGLWAQIALLGRVLLQLRCELCCSFDTNCICLCLIDNIYRLKRLCVVDNRMDPTC